jgi:hypothetical protein
MQRCGEGYELPGFVAGESSAGRSRERIGGVFEIALEVGRVEVDLVGCEYFELVFLEGERGKGSAGEIVVLAAIFHGRPVADGSGPDPRSGGRGLDQLLECLRAVEDAGGGLADDADGLATGRVLVREKDVAFVVHGGVEGELVCRQKLAGLGCIGAEEADGDVR